jgi:hypothetical protein
LFPCPAWFCRLWAPLFGGYEGAIDKALVPPNLLPLLEWGEKSPPQLLQGAVPSPALQPVVDRAFGATLILDSGVLADQQLNERTKQRFASPSDVVHKLEETQGKGEFLL